MSSLPASPDARLTMAVCRTVLRLYPSEFRESMGEDLLATIQDQLGNHCRRVSLAGFWISDLPDLLRMAFRERFREMEKTMKTSQRILQAVGVLLIAYWLVIAAWSMIRAFHLAAVPDPFLVLEGVTISSIEMFVFESSLVFGPPLALLIFLLPLVSIQKTTDTGGGILIRVLRPARVSRLFLGCAALITIWLVTIPLWRGL